MGSSGGGGGNDGYFNFNTYTPPTYDEYKKNFSKNNVSNFFNQQGNSRMLSQTEYASSLSQNGGPARSVRFKVGTDVSALNYLLKNHPDHVLFQQGEEAQARRDEGGNAGIMFDNQGKLDPIAHNAIYVGGSATNTESRAYKDNQQAIEGAAANKKTKNASVLATNTGSKGTIMGGGAGAPAAANEGASKPGSILGGVNSEAIKTLLGV